MEKLKNRAVIYLVKKDMSSFEIFALHKFQMTTCLF